GDSERLVKPTRSAKSTGTRRRSAVRPLSRCGGGEGWLGAVMAAAAAVSSAEPHSLQNRCPASYGSPQLGHASASAAPQFPQNFALALLSWLQDGQVIDS